MLRKHNTKAGKIGYVLRTTNTEVSTALLVRTNNLSFFGNVSSFHRIKTMRVRTNQAL